MAIERFLRAELPATPWKNGGGLTREIVCRPQGAGMDGFGWRASIAEISADGPFSVFPGVDRVIVLLSGGGVALRSPDGGVSHRLSDLLEPFAFSGDESIHASLIAGASADFNVMTRRTTIGADVQIVRTLTRLEESTGGVLLAVRGSWNVTVSGCSAEHVRTLEPDTGLWWDDESLAWNAEPRNGASALMVVRTWRL